MARSSPLVPTFVAVALLLSVVIAFASLLATVTAQSAESLPDDTTLLKMKVKQLKAYLEKKGPDAACLACTSKQEYVSRIHETIDWPDVTPAPTDEQPSMEELQKMFADSQNDQRILELKKKLEEAGIDASKIFTTSGINAEEIRKEKEKWEKLRENLKKGNSDHADSADSVESADDDSDVSEDKEGKTDL